MDVTRVGAISTFTGLPDTELAAIASVAFEREVAQGEILVAEGDFGHTVFVIESGTADVLSGDETVDTVKAGDVIGEIAVLSSGRRVASIRAASPMTVICLFKRDVWSLDRRAPQAAERLLATLDQHRLERSLRSGEGSGADRTDPLSGPAV